MALRLKFMSAVIRKDDVADYYPDGCAAFETRHPAALEDDALYGLISMSWADLEDCLDQLYLEGFDPDVFVAVADMGLGPVKDARGIRFSVVDDEPFGAWIAEAPNEPIEAPTLPKPPVPVSSLDYRPRDYFGRLDLEAELLTRVKGRARREAIKDALDKGEIDQIPLHIRAPELDEAERQRIGRVHPLFMGGEYLPRLEDGEVEIARISIKSTTYDVTALYARLEGGRIHYRVVDEYDAESLGVIKELTSLRPLTMGKLVDFFITAWDMMAVLEDNFGSDVDGMLDFFNGESEFYPCFDAALREQVIHRFVKDEDEEEDEVTLPEEMVAVRLTPELLAAITPEDSDEARALTKRRILSTPAWWDCGASIISESELPESLRERIAQFSSTLPRPTGAISGMARGSKLAKLRGRARLYLNLNGELPDADRLKKLFNLN